ncbi:unnamed protein product [Cuscuta campestris]|uniref:Retrotransposon gag domain-containing protein n=2 Tax=Cuscuta campestris TaxID=132261 RepID=A0A484M2T7_9ASTE|nr:unnamed protein product [Cuscuta campestris]
MTSEANPLTEHLAAIDTRFKELRDAIHDTTKQLQEEFETRLALHASKLDSQYARVEALILPYKGGPSHAHNRGQGFEDGYERGGTSFTPKPKLEPPKCDGSDPLRWLYKVTEYFAFYDTPPDERLRCVPLMLEGAAADWFWWRKKNNLLLGWDDFVEKFKQRFDPNQYVDYFGQLAKLRQRGSVMEYQDEFEKVLQHVSGAHEDILISLFHAGLKHHLQKEIIMLKPATLSESFSMARELEAKHSALVHSIQQRSASPFSPSPRGAPQGLKPATTAPLLPTPPKPLPHNPGPIKRLTPAEKEAKDAKGLCYNCDQKWSRNHKCGRFLILCGDDDDDEAFPPDTEEDLLVAADISSLNNFSSIQPPRSLRLVGRVGCQDVRVLIDGGSTHNFIHPEIVGRLQLPLTAVAPFRVYVGNGDAMPCASQCTGVPLLMQNHIFSIDLFVLQIHGQDIVLGVQWLQQLGKITQDYAQLTLDFIWEGQPIQLRGDSTPKPVSFAMFKALQSFNSLVAYYELLALPKDDPPTSPATDQEAQIIPAAITELLSTFAGLRELLHQVVQTPDQQYYVRKLMGFQFRIEYKPGASNRVADALSRREDGEGLIATFMHLSRPVPALMEAIRTENQSQPDLMGLHAAASEGKLPLDFSIADGMLFYRRRLCIGRDSPLWAQLLREYHDSPLAGHPGIQRTFYRLAMHFHWPGMRRDIQRHIEACTICQVTKYSTQPPAGLLQPLPIPLQPLPLPRDFVDGRPPARPVRVHGQRTTLVAGQAVRQALVEWSDGGMAEATWEPIENLHRHFLDLHLEDKVLVDPVGNVMNDVGHEHTENEELGETEEELGHEDLGSNLESDMGQDVEHEETDVVPDVRKSSRVRRLPAWQKDYLI